LLLLLVGLMLFVFQVRTSEAVVITTFGRPTRDISEPGPHLKLPWPIERVHRLDQRVQNFEDRLTQGLTSDSFNLLTSVYVGWKITDPKVFFPKFADSSEPIARAEERLEEMLSNAKMAVEGKHPLADFLAPPGSNNKFEQIELEIMNQVQTQVHNNHYGLELKFLGLKKLQLPEGVTTAVFERMTKERQVLASRSEYEGQAEAQKIRSEADRKAQEVLSAAASQATAIRGQGEAEAAKSLAVFQQNPELAVFIFGLNAMEDSLKDHSTLILDQQTPPFNLFRGISTNLYRSVSTNLLTQPTPVPVTVAHQ
ncbi:MAG: protease modulator HflC, partial [Limisphaerales bacterium]